MHPSNTAVRASLLFVLQITAVANGAELSVEQTDRGVIVKQGNRLFAEYLVKSGTKPILWPIHGPTDKPLTRAFPMQGDTGEETDHVHHRSLWFTHGLVNGIDFWKESASRDDEPPKGTIQHREFTKVTGGTEAVIVARNDWIGPNGKKHVEENRTMTFRADESARSIDFDVKLTASDGAVRFGDTKEGTFGVRVASTMRVDAKQGGRILNSAGQVDVDTWGQRASWVDYHGPVDGERVGIAILNHPSSFRYPTFWMVRTYGLFAANPFGEHEFTEAGDGSHLLPTGQSLNLRYRLILHKGNEREAQIAKAFEDYTRVAPAAAQEDSQLAFPGAEGFGRFAKGGRGGDVYHVTNLDDAGPGSLREGIRTANGPRTIVFDVAGTIELKKPLSVDKSFLTIAGQTAPGDGICIKDQTFEIKKAAHIIVRYVRFRLGDQNKPAGSSPDCVNTDDVDHLIFDHISATWGIDGNHDLRRGGKFTLQWSIYAEALNHSLHGKGAHAMLASFRDLTDSISLHHNLFASSRDRHPTLGSSPKTKASAIVDFRNNVIYNLSGATNLGNCRINVINNTYLPGPDTPKSQLPLATKIENEGTLKAFVSGNLFKDSPLLSTENWRAVDFDRWTEGSYRRTTLEQARVEAEHDVGGAKLDTQSAIEAYELVLQNAGASRRRDAADVRLVRGVRDRSNRLIDSQKEVGGWPALAGDAPPKDTDRDGMPDAWELAHGLNTDDPADRNGDRDQDGFTNLEEYLNELCPAPSLTNEEVPKAK